MADLARIREAQVRAAEDMIGAELAAKGLAPAASGLSLDANEVNFLAARLRRLFAHFDFQLPEFASDDARLIGIAPSVIGMLLCRWETDGPTWHAVISNAAPGINKAIRRADVADEYADKCRRDGYTGVEVVPLYAHASGVTRLEGQANCDHTPMLTGKGGGVEGK